MTELPPPSSALIRAIKGAVCFPLIFLFPLACLIRQFRSFSLLTFRLLRTLFLLLAWCFLVFGPLMFLDEVRDPDIAMAIVAWSLMLLFATLLAVTVTLVTLPTKDGAV